jgi:chromosome segregation ATPase
MEWVIAILAIGCLFFAFQIIMDFVKHKAVVEPRIQRLEAARGELERKIEEARRELEKAQSELGPTKDELETLEREYISLQEQIRGERAKTRRRSPMVGGEEGD